MVKNKSINPDDFSREFEKSLRPDVLKKVRDSDFGKISHQFWSELIELTSIFIPIVRFFKSYDLFKDYKEYRLGCKVLNFLIEFSKDESITQDDIEKLAEELDNVNHESLFNTLLDTLDRIDNINKANVLANILRYSAKGYISKDNFLRHSWILSSIPYIDLQNLHNYIIDFYKPSSSEILFSMGLIRETLIDSDNRNNNLYGLSPLGQEMLHYGLVSIEWEYKGAHSKIPIASDDEVVKMINDILSNKDD